MPTKLALLHGLHTGNVGAAPALTQLAATAMRDPLRIGLGPTPGTARPARQRRGWPCAPGWTPCCA